jgi:hypothetical protein
MARLSMPGFGRNPTSGTLSVCRNPRRPGPKPPPHRKLDDTEDAVVGFRTEATKPEDESALFTHRPTILSGARSAGHGSIHRPLRAKDPSRPEGSPLPSTLWRVLADGQPRGRVPNRFQSLGTALPGRLDSHRTESRFTKSFKTTGNGLTVFTPPSV